MNEIENDVGRVMMYLVVRKRLLKNLPPSTTIYVWQQPLSYYKHNSQLESKFLRKTKCTLQ